MPEADTTPAQSKDLDGELEQRGHVVTSWENLGSITIEATGVVTSQYRIGRANSDDSPTVFRAWFPPHCRIEAHTHRCDYSEIILSGSQKVSGRWLNEGNIRIGLANQVYGPLIAGPDGVTVLVIFADGNWAPITVGSGDGGTLGSAELLNRFSTSEQNAAS